MSLTRDNHYVPQWYQRLFFEPGESTLAYLDMAPERRRLEDGREIIGKALFRSPPKRCFFQTDLYSTFFGTLVNDEIERKLFGAIDDRGSKAVKAFLGTDESAWHDHFQNLFEFIDVQRLRTPKGLDWLRAQYPTLSQNELMIEMQGLRNLHCTIWTEGVREIVSAEEAGTKFIISDAPVTIYNHALPPNSELCAYPGDPGIALKASQTLFPLSRDFCLILTNLEYAQAPEGPALEKRTFARNYRNSMVSTVAFVRTRKLNDHQVAQINLVLKCRARRYIAAGRDELLHPEGSVTEPWAELRETLLPRDQLYEFGGEIYAKFEDGHVHFQDAFGRTEKPREFLLKPARSKPPKPGDACGCGSGDAYRTCCKPRPAALRPSWDESSIRERNLSLHRGIINILRLDPGRDWTTVRRELTDEQISKVYHLYEALWPLETDLLKLLPKPDGRPRAVFTGSIHPETLIEFAFAAPLYFGELIVEHPFTHNGAVAGKYKPVDNPRSYHLEFLKAVVLFLNIMPLVDLGLVNLIPDPCNFDLHLRDQMMRMAQERAAGMTFDSKDEPRVDALFRRDFKRHFLMWPDDGLIAQLRDDFPDITDTGIADMLKGIEHLKEADPLVALAEDIFGGGKQGGQLQLFKLSPNFEMAMYLAQATGAAIITDSRFRWRELQSALRPRYGPVVGHLGGLAREIERATFHFPDDTLDVARLGFDGGLDGYPRLIGQVFTYLSRIAARGPKPNWEAAVAARFARDHKKAQAAIASRGLDGSSGRVRCAFPAGGIQDNTVNRLLLMSSSEHHLPGVPMAFFIEPPTREFAPGQAILANPIG
ncbi:DUF4238 domain-containing protein [Sphingopyxis indica]|uniref:SEC-C motif-containing protein n=1 Tax=Sphingopyxis indica TaxID=436663 RepID=A0A239L7A5_9SPHN|nr:DUF4238 domain-containing protein [Sphingopyxis indica]SNT26160.1 Protein of unknown function [Sphingopyxis indica]